MACIADTFQYDGSMDGLTGLAEERGISRATKQVQFLEVEGDETNRPGQSHVLDLASDMEDHGKRARIIIGARRTCYGIKVRAENQWWQWAVRGGWRCCPNDVVIGTTQRFKLMRRNGQTCFRELPVQIGFCLLKADRGGNGVTFSDQVVQVLFEAMMISRHVGLIPSGGFR